ncbi:endonuclease domain-containing protein [Novosphingobium cyanobacteriorum]|uniref:Endonuclease domain-containing protein n=1 Tax=Novosphingobium cyanobacteriorum TaxID=3024215 RepID=A0ABT6CFC7_9SPHN|nr:endonuclease domain-containing protein [Novosphingobium cyanobacteriorum]MDF8331800.1 endonuclease domain-containing protein [Novosphingobium cyanobacteriorum]
MRNHSESALRSARRLRREMSLPEVLLWRSLRDRPMDVKFRRQHPLGDYVVDFFCSAARLIVEIDGIAHDMGQRPLSDHRRDRALMDAGFRVVRIPAADVLRNADEVADSLVRLCLASPPPSGAAHLPPPPMGEDL